MALVWIFFLAVGFGEGANHAPVSDAGYVAVE